MWLLTGIIILGSASALASPPAGRIHVEIANFHNSVGQVGCALFSSAEGFPMDLSHAMRQSTGAIRDKRASCEFDDVAPGTYAIAVLHDENSDGKIATNFMGIPTEGVGASNDAKPSSFSGPKFSDASFQFKGGLLNLQIRVEYY